MFSFTEDTFEQAVIELFENMGYTHIYAPDMDRTDYSRPLLDTAITLVSIAVGVYIAAVSALLGSPYAKELKQETDKKKQEIRYWEHCRTILDAQENLAL